MHVPWGVGWDCVIDTVHFYSSGLSAIVADDLFDTQFYNTRINSCGKLHDPSDPRDIFTHAILFRGKYDNCNAIRFYAPHFESNFVGVLGISGRSNNIWLDSAKFENNSRGTASGVSYPVVDLNGIFIEAIKFSSPFVSHPSHIKQWFLSSNARNVEIIGGSFMSPSDLSGHTAERWFNIHRTGWASATRCVGLVADITMMHVNGSATLGDAPIKLANDAVLSIKAPRVTDPNKFIEASYDCDININYLTLLGTTTSERQTALFNVTAPDAKVNIDIERMVGSPSNLVTHNQNMTPATRRKSKATIRYQNTQNAVGTLTEGTDTFGVDESYVWQAKGEVANLPPCHVGKQLIVRCPDTSNRLVRGGNVFLTSDITGAATVVLQSTNFSFRQGWMEVSRLNGV